MHATVCATWYRACQASKRPTWAPTPEVREYVKLDDELSPGARLKMLERRLEEASFKVAKSLLHPLSVDSKGTSHPAFTERPGYPILTYHIYA